MSTLYTYNKQQFNADVSLNSNTTFNNTSTQISSSGVVGISGGIVNISGGVINIGGKTQFTSDVSLNGHITTTVDGKRFTSTSNSRFTSASTFTTFINNDKTGGDVRINTGSPGSNVIVENGNLGVGTSTFPGTNTKVNIVGTNPILGLQSGGGSDSMVGLQAYNAGIALGNLSGNNLNNTLFVNTSSGNVGIGTTNPGSKLDVRGTVYVSSGANISSTELIMTLDGSEGSARFYGAGWMQDVNAAKSAMKIGRSSETSRSISASGTINASASDYAEYMRKKDNTFTINKGDICGIDTNSKLTNVYDEAYSFVVKSTSPSYVGGDNWHDPSDNMPDISNNDAYTAWEVRYEARRALVDRIAFCGQVPVNIDTTYVKVGDFILPNRKSDGMIEAISVSKPTFDQYQIAVGKVINILSSTQAYIIVKIC